METKESLRKLLKFFAFILIAFLPFISATQIIGLETFLDSYERPEYYIVVESKEDYKILQKASHPEFIIKNEDTIYYYQENGEITQDKIYEISAIGPFKKYFTSENETPIFEQQIIGKIIKQFDESPLNTISIKTWEISIHNLNLRALILD
jgi:hypothetical protein